MLRAVCGWGPLVSTIAKVAILGAPPLQLQARYDASREAPSCRRNKVKHIAPGVSLVRSASGAERPILVEGRAESEFLKGGGRCRGVDGAALQEGVAEAAVEQKYPAPVKEVHRVWVAMPSTLPKKCNSDRANSAEMVDTAETSLTAPAR